MIKDSLVQMIMTARKANEKDKVSAYQDLKNEFMKFTTAKNAKPLDEEAEFQILRKLIKECQDAAEMNNDGKHDDIVAESKREAEILSELLPAGPSEADIKNAIEAFIASLDCDFDRKQMGACIKEVKGKFPTADGKTVSTLVQSYL